MRHSLFRILNPTASLFDKLIVLRILVIIMAGLAGAFHQLELLYWLIIGSYILYSLFTYFKIKPSSMALMLSLLIDLGVLSYLLYLNDGVLSGWVSLLLFPALVGALALSSRRAWMVALSSMLAYAGLMFIYLQQTSMHSLHGENHGSNMSDHLMGMLVSFIISVTLLTAFISNQAKILRVQQKQLKKLQDQKWREQHILALATLAANTTHKIATPLSSAMMMIDELEEQSQEFPAFEADGLSKIKQELLKCSDSLSNLVARARSFDPDVDHNEIISEWLHELIHQWWNSHNEIALQLRIEDELSTCEIAVNSNLDFAITNLLDNAAKACANASVGAINVHAYLTGKGFCVKLIDNGEGLEEELLASLGKGFVPSKYGLGMGVTLAQSAIEQIGGNIRMENNAEGVSTRVYIPLQTGNSHK